MKIQVLGVRGQPRVSPTVIGNQRVSRRGVRSWFSRWSCRGGQPRRRGAAAVEFAIIAPVFFLLVFGIIEFGRMFMVQHIVRTACREGARRAIIQDATVAEVQAAVTQNLTDGGVNGATITITPNDLASAVDGAPITVGVSIPFNSVSWLPNPWFLDGRVVNASTTFRSERVD